MFVLVWEAGLCCKRLFEEPTKQKRAGSRLMKDVSVKPRNEKTSFQMKGLGITVRKQANMFG